MLTPSERRNAQRCRWLEHVSSLAIGSLIAAGSVSSAELRIYRHVDASGVEHFSDAPIDGGGEVFMRIAIADPARTGLDTGKGAGIMAPPGLPAAISSHALHGLIAAASEAHALDPALVHAVIMVESAYDAGAISPKGARGLMQLMPATARRFGVRDPHDATQNLAGGTRYLRYLIDLFAGDLTLALAAYNAGENAVIRHGRRIPPFAETLAYVPKVMARYAALRSSGGHPVVASGR